MAVECPVTDSMKERLKAAVRIIDLVACEGRPKALGLPNEESLIHAESQAK